MLKKTLGLAAWVFCFQLIAYFILQFSHLHLSTWYDTLDKIIVFHPPEIIFPIIWSTLYVMVTIAGWLLWQERRNPSAKPALIYYWIQVLLNWTWPIVFFRLHWTAASFFWMLAAFGATFMTILNSAEDFEFAASLLTPYLFWLLYIACFTAYHWLHR